MKHLVKELNFCGPSLWSWQHDTQVKSSKQAKTTFYEIPVWLPAWLESFKQFRRHQTKFLHKQTIFCGYQSTFKMGVNCCNEKLWKRGEEISKIIYYLLTIFLIVKVKQGLNLHFLFISCKLSVYGMIYNPMKSSDIGWFFVNFPPWKWK